ncbi:MAG: ferrous iron transport protein B, partial [Desulfovibrionaceae bacterium]
RFKLNGDSVELVDLPGTYSMTSYSMEERVARDFLFSEKPTVVVGVADASNLKRHLHLAFQLMEMGKPLVLALNMMDVAESRGQRIDAGLLASKLGVPAVPMVARKGQGKDELVAAIAKAASGDAGAPLRLDYGPLEQPIFMLEKALAEAPDLGAPGRWLSLKLLEGDEIVRESLASLGEAGDKILALADELADSYRKSAEESPDRAIERRRFETAEALARECVHAPDEGGRTFSDKVDSVICHRFAGYPILFGVLYLMYYLSIEQGYELTNYTWPLLAGARDLIAGWLPAEGFVSDPILRSLVLWIVDSVNGLLNYIPIFLILFVYIAFLEDLGYMPRMAFLLDAFFRRYGLHGQSTLPLVLGGVYVGGCAVPGVMACRAVPDERARLATILVVPMMNCLAKVPLYILLIGVYFAASKGPAMFFIATITILMALTTSKLLNMSVLKSKETAPFIMEMPPYHRPTAHAVLRRGVERVWLYVKKITTVVAAVAVVLFVLMQFPGLSGEQKTSLEARQQIALEQFFKAAQKSEYGNAVDTLEKVQALFAFASDFNNARRGVGSQAESEALAARFQEKNSDFYAILLDRRDRQAKVVNRAYKRLRRIRLGLRKEAKDTIIDNSFLGRLGKWMEPVTQYAGFSWRVNVSLLSALAAKENTVATLGALYQQEESDGAENNNGLTQSSNLEQRMARQEAGFTPLHALALMLFMALYPPCMATTMVVKVQSGSWKWMLFSLVYMTGLGALAAVLVFTGGSMLGLTGQEAMAWFYGIAVAATIATGLVKPKTATH